MVKEWVIIECTDMQFGHFLGYHIVRAKGLNEERSIAAWSLVATCDASSGVPKKGSRLLFMWNAKQHMMAHLEESIIRDSDPRTRKLRSDRLQSILSAPYYESPRIFFDAIGYDPKRKKYRR